MLSLNDREWKEFHISSFVNSIDRGKVKNLNNIETGDTIVIAAAGVNEGFSTFAQCEKLYNNAMTISFNGVGTGTSFVHNYPFNLNSDCGVVKLKDNLSINVLRFIQCSINMHKNKFNYGYKANETRLKRQIILLPINNNGELDYEFMEHFIKEREQIKRKKYIDYCKKQLNKLGKSVDIEPLKNKEWNSFFITDIFDEIARGKRLKKDEHISGNKPYVSSTSMNNGVDRFIGNDNKIRVYSECLSLANSGSVGSCFYEPFEFIASDHVTHLKNKNMSPYTYLFISSMLSRLSEKYNFNREINDNRIKREKVFLPCLSDGKPDYVYMEQYTKNIMIKKYNEYLDYINN